MTPYSLLERYYYYYYYYYYCMTPEGRNSEVRKDGHCNITVR
jgi:hypothetical protein